MKVLFIIAICIIVFGVINYEKMSYKATYFRNKKKHEEKKYAEVNDEPQEAKDDT